MKVEQEVKKCDVCGKLYIEEDFAWYMCNRLHEYKLVLNNKPLDMCPKCLYRFLNAVFDIKGGLHEGRMD